MKTLCFAALAAVTFTACATDIEPEGDRSAIAKADSVGTCEGACGDVSAAGDCYCDELCSEYGDCCADVVETCSLSECSAEQDNCGPGAWCQPGVCLHWCSVDDPGCCSPDTCQPLPCPPIAYPGEGFCEEGEEIVSISDAQGHCVIGFECAKPIHPGICGDGTQPLCTVIPEPCPEGQVREHLNHCYGQCVNPVSCLPPPTPL